MENNKTWRLTYDLLTTDGVEKIEVQFTYFKTCLMTVKNLSKHCCIDNIHISLIKQEVKKCYLHYYFTFHSLSLVLLHF